MGVAAVLRKPWKPHELAIAPQFAAASGTPKDRVISFIRCTLSLTCTPPYRGGSIELTSHVPARK